MAQTLLNAPPKMAKKQLVFCRDFESPFALDTLGGAEFFLECRAWKMLGLFPKIVRACGLKEAIKGCARLVRGRQFIYGVLAQGHVAHFGWVTKGTCKHYPVEDAAHVIGPIWSSPEFRGRGFATYATKRAVNEILGRGGRVVYIDTFEENFPCLKVIDNCGFGASVSSFDRCD